MRIKNSKAIISFVFCLFASSAAVSEIKLYKGVSLGDEWNKIVETVGYYDCSESGLKIACLDNQKFLGAIGDLGVFFDTEAAVKVMFVSEDLSLYQKAMKFFPSKGFALVAIETNNGANDFIAMNKQNGPEKAVAKLIEIEQFGLSNGFVSYTFLEGDQKSILNYGNIAQAYASLNSGDRALTVSVSEEVQAVNVMITFEPSLVDLNELQERNKLTEDF